MFKDKSLSRDIVFFSLLVFLLPLALITGPAAPDIILSIVALFFLIQSFTKKLWFYYYNPLVIGISLFCLYGIIRSLFSDLPIYSLLNEGSLFYFRYIFFALGVWYLLDKNPYFSKCLIIIIISSILIVSVDGFIQYFYDTNTFGNPKHSNYRLTGLFRDEPIIGRYISYMSIFCFFLIYQNFAPTQKIVIFSIFILMISEIVIFLTGERAALFYLILFSILVIVFFSKFRIYIIVGFLLSTIILSFFININSSAKTRMIDFTITQMSNTKFSFLPYSEHHERIYFTSIKMFLDKPITGIGTNLFKYKCDEEKFFYKKNSCSTHPHNYYVQSLAELGIIGFMFIMSFFIFILFFVIRQFYYQLRANEEKIIPFNYFLIFLVLLVYWWPIIPHMSLYNNWNNIFLMLPMGFLLKFLYGQKKTNKFI